jgi:hypothetical protein
MFEEINGWTVSKQSFVIFLPQKDSHFTHTATIKTCIFLWSCKKKRTGLYVVRFNLGLEEDMLSTVKTKTRGLGKQKKWNISSSNYIIFSLFLLVCWKTTGIKVVRVQNLDFTSFLKKGFIKLYARMCMFQTQNVRAKVVEMIIYEKKSVHFERKKGVLVFFRAHKRCSFQTAFFFVFSFRQGW